MSDTPTDTKPSFIHLHVHSHYTLLGALPKISDLVEYAKELNMPALALTDAGNLYGAIDFYKECKDAGIKPIIGVDAYVAARTRFDKQSGIDSKRSRLVLLAKNADGYRNLIKLVTASFMEGFYYKPRVDHEIVEKFKEHLIAISPSFSGEISTAVRLGDREKAQKIAAFYKKTFGDDFYIEITHHPEIDGHEMFMQDLVKFAREENIPLVAAHDVYYLKPEDHAAYEVVLSIQKSAGGERTGGFGGDAEKDFSFIGQERAKELFVNEPDALENSVKIADMCNLDMTLGKWLFPRFDVPEGRTHDDVLRELVIKGAEFRGVKLEGETKERMEYELDVIKKKGYASYFLVVSDLLNEAHRRGILTTIRGSVAGSLVTYLARITNVNPIEYKLPFERFLNPERPSAPDIDMDYADNRRDEMIEYAKQKYGTDKVAQIGTFGTMMARGAVRDVGRAMGYPYSLGDTIAKLIPMGSQGMPMTTKKALTIEPELKKLYEKDRDVQTVINMAQKIEGNARHISVHAAGVVMSPITLTDIVPLQYDPKGEGRIITQYDMYSVDENNVGLMKFDFLGIRNLAILADAVALVKTIENVDIDIENIPLDDPKTFAMLARGETEGLFQLNGSGMTRYLKELKPTTIHDINAMVALYRPGPMESIPQYVERKHNPQLVTYLDPRLKTILDRSYGLITYQDDVMMIAINLGGYSWLEADKLRKAMGKKIPEVMAAERQKLVDGLVKNGLSEQKADILWKLIEPFAGYGFNKAHAASYGRVAYQTAYMKANFPAIYMSAVLTAESGDVETVAIMIHECERMGIPVLPPDVNESFTGFTVIKGKSGAEGDASKDSIRFGLYTIKNVGTGIADAIIAERKRGGHFKSISDFLLRVHDKSLNRKSLESLIKCGAFDTMGERGNLMANIEELLRFNKEHAVKDNPQDSLFSSLTVGDPVVTLQKSEPAPMDEKLLWEKDLLGLYISGHPLDKFKEQLDKVEVKIGDIKRSVPPGIQTVAYGFLESVRPIYTKKGDKMLFLKITDTTGGIEAVVFPKTLEQYPDLFIDDACIAVKGRLSERNGEKSIVVEKAKKL